MHPAPHPYQLEAKMARLLSSHEFSQHWQQGNKHVVMFAILITFLGYVSVFAFGLHPPLGLSLVSILLLLLGLVADSLTTYRIFSIKPRFDERGLEFSIKEANPLMSPFPTPLEIFFGKPALLAAIAIVATFFIPLAGWGVAATLFTVSLNNHNNRKQAQCELQLYDTMTERLGKRKEIPAKEYLYAIPTVTG